MNKQEFDNLKVGDKVVVARVLYPSSNRYQGDLNPFEYLSKEGVVEDVYTLGDGCIAIRFEFTSDVWYFNIEDIDLITEKETDMQKTKTPHKHADIIKAWADGEEIEVRATDGRWINLVSQSPSWLMDEYRIKPKFEKRYLYAYQSQHDNQWRISEKYYSDNEWNQTRKHLESVKIEASSKDFQIN